eukprot:CAMPEP_0181501458 /NCGR_PEP_ID=MMETSP1110-20121109/55804_1 /TAXON_ID=174948 /ORGANISM="Symbiodinium sp., Strain CCMP421" /LENGTH=76 /DNA_ID=CAMNT_0023629915 /DNA_START=101 /DNA_END=331 /DNA_ORIENTATION=-
MMVVHDYVLNVADTRASMNKFRLHNQGGRGHKLLGLAVLDDQRTINLCLPLAKLENLKEATLGQVIHLSKLRQKRD